MREKHLTDFLCGPSVAARQRKQTSGDLAEIFPEGAGHGLVGRKAVHDGTLGYSDTMRALYSSSLQGPRVLAEFSQRAVRQ